MSFAEAQVRRDVWVFYRKDSGSIFQVRLKEPLPFEMPGEDDEMAVLVTSLSVKAIHQAHQLVVRNGRVQVRGSLARRR